MSPRPGFVDARTTTGVPCVTVLPDPRVSAFVRDVLGVPLTRWQEAYVQGAMRNR